jgi:hypothetical protein
MTSAGCGCEKNEDGICLGCRELLYGSFRLIIEGTLFAAEKEMESHRTCPSCAGNLGDWVLSRIFRELLGDSPSEVRRRMLTQIVRGFKDQAGLKTPLLDREMEKCGEAL